MSTLRTELVLPIRPHINQLPLINSTARYNVIAAGRRFGKTEAMKLRVIYKTMQGKVWWWVNPTFENGTDTWLDFLNFYAQFVPRENINKSSRRVFLPNGGQLRMVGANNFKRGSGVDGVTVDEAAFCNLDELWQYQLRPMLLENKGEADFGSSTNGRNFFWSLYQMGKDPEKTDWQSWHFTSYDNPLLDINEIDSIRNSTPERVFDQEYMAAFLEDGGAVFRNLQACVRNEPPEEAGRIVFGVDLGRHNDYTVITAIDVQAMQVVDIDRFTGVEWELQRKRLNAMAKKWHPYVMVVEENFNDMFAETLRKDGLKVHNYRTTHGNKQNIINTLALAFEQESLFIPDNPTLIHELQAYTLERLPGGTFRYGAPSGMHDDMVMSLAFAYYAALHSKPRKIEGIRF